MILVAMAGAALLHVSDPGDAAQPAEGVYFACLVKAAEMADDHIQRDTKYIAATIQGDCEKEAWAYLVALNLARSDKTSVDPRAGDIIRDETDRAIRAERHQPGGSTGHASHHAPGLRGRAGAN